MPPLNPDISRVTENLRYSYQRDHADNFFSKDVDTWFALLQEKKESDRGGAGFVVQVLSRGSIKNNPTFSLTTKGIAARTQFIFQAVDHEWRAAWTRDEWLSAGDKGVIGQFDLAKEVMDQAMYHAKVDLGKTMGLDGWGTLAGIAQISGSTITIGQPDGGATVTAVPALTNRFYDGQILVASDIVASGTLRGADPGDTLTIATGGVNRTTGVLTFTAAVSTTAFAVGDFLAEKGYRNYDSANGRITVNGIEAWLPVDVVTDVFGGKSRNNRPDLQPHRFDASSVATSTVETQLIRADEFAVTHGLKTEGLMILTSPQTFRELIDGAVNKSIVQLTVERTGASGNKYTIGYSAFMLNGQSGPIEVVPSSFIRPGIAYWGPFKSKLYGFKLLYAGDMIMNINDIDGLIFRSADVVDPTGNTVDGFEAKGYFRGQVTCGHAGVYLAIKGIADTAI